MVRIAVLGAGFHSSGQHGPALQQCQAERLGQVELAAVCDLDRQRAVEYAACFGFARAYADLEEMVAREQPDGVVAVTPLEHTESLVRRLGELGIPVLIEKPPGHDLASAERLQQAFARSRVPHMVSFNRRFSPAFARARAWLAEQGAARGPVLALGRMLRHNRREDGFAFGTGIHLVDAILALMGRPTAVVCQLHAIGAQATPFFEARLALAGGGAATLLLAPACGRVEESIELLGDGFQICVDLGECRLRVRDGARDVLTWDAPAAMPPHEQAGALDEARAFIACLESGQGWWPTLAEALWSVRAADAMQRGGETLIP
ncbi:MAG: Gfo/Idh/MocA family oxidoreductase [Candidatus Latescibacterota bacterium]